MCQEGVKRDMFCEGWAARPAEAVYRQLSRPASRRRTCIKQLGWPHIMQLHQHHLGVGGGAGSGVDDGGLAVAGGRVGGEGGMRGVSRGAPLP